MSFISLSIGLCLSGIAGLLVMGFFITAWHDRPLTAPVAEFIDQSIANQWLRGIVNTIFVLLVYCVLWPPLLIIEGVRYQRRRGAMASSS